MAVKKEPQNIDAEISVLSCAFLSEEALDKVCEDLTLDYFYDESNRKIYEVIKELKSKGISKNYKAIFLCGDNYRKNFFEKRN